MAHQPSLSFRGLGSVGGGRAACSEGLPSASASVNASGGLCTLAPGPLALACGCAFSPGPRTLRASRCPLGRLQTQSPTWLGESFQDDHHAAFGSAEPWPSTGLVHKLSQGSSWQVPYPLDPPRHPRAGSPDPGYWVFRSKSIAEANPTPLVLICSQNCFQGTAALTKSPHLWTVKGWLVVRQQIPPGVWVKPQG